MPVIDTIERVTLRFVPVTVIDASPLLTCTTADPFGIDHDCRNPAGHDFIADCRDLVCVHCGRISWR